MRNLSMLFCSLLLKRGVLIVILTCCLIEAKGQLKFSELTWTEARSNGDSIELGYFNKYFLNVFTGDTTIDIGLVASSVGDSTFKYSCQVDKSTGNGNYQVFYQQVLIQELKISEWKFNGSARQYLPISDSAVPFIELMIEDEKIQGTLIEYWFGNVASVSIFSNGEFVKYLFYNRKILSKDYGLSISPLESIVIEM